MAKIRLDDFLIEKGFFETKSKAQGAILAGKVKVNNEKITKAGFQIKDEVEIEVQKNPYVSRGGFKLEKALKEFGINVKDKICLDAGASTGGFTDCMLQNGALKVYAVDVGHNQIDWKFRSDSRVVVIEKTNIKNCCAEQIYGDNPIEADFLSADLSFISLNKVLANMKNLTRQKAMLLLIKPQFEAGRENIDIREFSPCELLREVVEMIEPQTVEKNITLKTDCDEFIPHIWSDYEKCRHILQNIVANAVKFTLNDSK
jgi:23S rRNA (cytidine1920-2'-O)/16S rRNA (cytidine1409-2'-O)-methyltransferase